MFARWRGATLEREVADSLDGVGELAWAHPAARS